MQELPSAVVAVHGNRCLGEVVSMTAVILLPLNRAALCVACDCLSNAQNVRCPACGSASLISLSRVPTQVKYLIESLAEHAIETGLTPKEIADHLEKRCLEIILDLEGGNQCATSHRIGIHRNTLARKIQRLGIERKGYTAKHGNRGELCEKTSI